MMSEFWDDAFVRSQLMWGLAPTAYDEASILREFGPLGVLEISKVDEPIGDGNTRPFLNVICELPR